MYGEKNFGSLQKPWHFFKRRHCTWYWVAVKYSILYIVQKGQCRLLHKQEISVIRIMILSKWKMALKNNYTNFGRKHCRCRKKHLWRVWRSYCVDSYKKMIRKLQTRWFWHREEASLWLIYSYWWWLNSCNSRCKFMEFHGGDCKESKHSTAYSRLRKLEYVLKFDV